MKNSPGNFTNIKKGIHSVHRSWILAMVMGVFLFTACSESSTFTSLDDSQIDTAEITPSDLKLLQPDEPIIIEGIFDSSTEMAKGRATDAAGVDRGRFNISLNFVLPVTPEQEQVFEDAAARWERIIIKDEPSFTGTLPSAFGGLPPVVNNGTLDDIVIEVALLPIDGPQGTLGAAGPVFIRNSNSLPLSGLMFFDVADLDFLDQLGLFEEVIVHEMGHVLGVGTLWNFNRNLLQDSNGVPYFAGKKANVFWNAEGGTEELPVEGDFGQGTAFSHWDEATLNNELMTGFLNLGENPLSRITAGSMRDLGYGSASVGESYDLPKGTPGVAAKAAGSGVGLDIASMEVLLEPIGFVNDKK